VPEVERAAQRGPAGRLESWLRSGVVEVARTGELEAEEVWTPEPTKADEKTRVGAVGA